MINIIFMGTPDFAATILEALLKNPKYNIQLVITQPDKPAGRKLKLVSPPVKEMALQKKLPLIQPDKIRDQEIYTVLTDLKPDLIVTAAYGKILPQVILDIPLHGCLNVHGSLLPDYRGSAPVQWSILNGDSKTGITIIKMDAGMDTGDMLSQVEIPILSTDTTSSLMDKLGQLGAHLLDQTIMDFLEKKIVLVPQDHHKATRAPMIHKDLGNINWQNSAWSIDCHVRALGEWPGAITAYEGKKLKIFAGKSYPTEEKLFLSTDLVAGKILQNNKEAFLVACGQGIFEILRLQSPNGKNVLGTDVAHNYPVGSFFENIRP